MDAVQERDVYKPSSEIVANANVKSYEEMADGPRETWRASGPRRPSSSSGSRSGTRCWTTRTSRSIKWFVGGKTNIVYNCLDRHVDTWRRNKLALIWEGENGEVRTFSYHALNREVCKFANVLRSMGVKKGDRVTIYMGRVPELPIAMLACAKIGAVHSVVYGGFSVEALHGRIEDSQSNVCITCDGGYMNGKIVELKKIVDEAIQRAATVEHVIVFKRTGQDVPMEQGRDYWWHDLMALPIARDRRRQPLRDRGDGRRGPALHALHLRHDRQAQGDPAHPRRLHGGRGRPRSRWCST